MTTAAENTTTKPTLKRAADETTAEQSAEKRAKVETQEGTTAAVEKPTQEKECPIKRQMEYYLSDANLKSDGFFREHIQKDTKEGWLSLDLVLKCNNVKKQGWTKEQIGNALVGKSTAVETKQEPEGTGKFTAIRRTGNTPLPAYEERAGRKQRKPKKVRTGHEGGCVLRVSNVPANVHFFDVKRSLCQGLTDARNAAALGYPGKAFAEHVSEKVERAVKAERKDHKDTVYCSVSPFTDDVVFFGGSYPEQSAEEKAAAAKKFEEHSKKFLQLQVVSREDVQKHMGIVVAHMQGMEFDAEKKELSGKAKGVFGRGAAAKTDKDKEEGDNKEEVDATSSETEAAYEAFLLEASKSEAVNQKMVAVTEYLASGKADEAGFKVRMAEDAPACTTKISDLAKKPEPVALTVELCDKAEIELLSTEIEGVFEGKPIFSKYVLDKRINCEKKRGMFPSSGGSGAGGKKGKGKGKGKGGARGTTEEQDRRKHEFKIANHVFHQLIDVKRKTREIQTSHEDKELAKTGSDFAFIKEIVEKYHPSGAEKLQGMEKIVVAKHPHFDSMCFHTVAADGTQKDFSMSKCFEAMAAAQEAQAEAAKKE